MTHAQLVRDAKERVVEAARADTDRKFGCDCPRCEAVRELERLIAETCPTCKGEGQWSAAYMSADGPSMDGGDCPTCHGSGRKVKS